MKNIPVKVVKKKIDDNKYFSKLRFNISGSDINFVVMNTIKRTIQSNIPIYAFKNIDIIKNNTIYNNNYIKLRLQNLPVWGIKNEMDKIMNTPDNITESDIDQENIMDDIDLTVETDINTSSLENLTLYVNYHNKTDSIYCLTTENVQFYYKQSQIKSPYISPVQIIKLQPGQEIKMSAQTDLGIEDTSAIFAATSVCHYIENSENNFDFILESKGQITEKRICIVAIKFIMETLQKFLSKVPDNDHLEGEIIIDNEDHTLGNILSYYIQLHDYVQFCGYNTPHILNKQIVIVYKLKKGKIKDVINDSVTAGISIFKNIYDQIEKL